MKAANIRKKEEKKKKKMKRKENHGTIIRPHTHRYFFTKRKLLKYGLYVHVCIKRKEERKKKKKEQKCIAESKKERERKKKRKGINKTNVYYRSEFERIRARIVNRFVLAFRSERKGIVSSGSERGFTK